MLEPIGWVLLKSSKHINKEGSITRLLSCRRREASELEKRSMDPSGSWCDSCQPRHEHAFMPEGRMEGSHGSQVLD